MPCSLYYEVLCIEELVARVANVVVGSLWERLPLTSVKVMPCLQAVHYALFAAVFVHLVTLEGGYVVRTCLQ